MVYDKLCQGGMGMKTVNEVSKTAGISVRTLHHYDAIGLLRPAKVTGAGYRLYDEGSLKRLETILMFRELGFQLAEIKDILDSPGFDLNAALGQHIEMLRLQRKHIDGLIEAAEKMKKGENAGFAAFDRSDMEQYAEEVKNRWGKTAAYAESREKMSGKTAEEKKNMADGLMEQFALLGSLKRLSPDAEEAQNAVAALQAYITDNYYTCTKEILAGLGEMYTADERFRENIDRAGGEGTAIFAREAIRVFCR